MRVRADGGRFQFRGSWKTFSVFIALISMLSIRASRGQSQTTGAIGGVASDPQKAVIPGATVTVRNEDTNSIVTSMTDPSGRYLVTNLQPGKYELTVGAANFGNFGQKDIQIEVGLVTTVDIALTLPGQVQTVTVTGQAPVVETEQSVFATNFNEADMVNLPINVRRWSYFALATPGAVADGTFGDVAFRGIGYIFDNNTVDGAGNTQAFFAEEVGRTRMAYSTSMNSIQEFQVSTSNYSAEYGRAVGGVINAVTKSGTNDLHGDLFYFNRDNSVGGAYAPFVTGAVLQPSGSYAVVRIKPTDIRQQLGGDIGGRLVKDKFFWYFNFDDQVHHFPITDIPSTPNNFFQPITVAAPASCGTAAQSGSAAPKTLTPGQVLACRGFTQTQVNSALAFLDSTTGTAPRTGDQTIYFPKIDWKPDGNDTITASYNRTRWTSPFGVQTGTSVARSIDSNGNDYVHDDRTIVSWSSIFGPTMTNNLRFIYSRDLEFENTTPSLPNEPVSSLTGLSPQADINACGFSNAGVTSLACAWTLGAPYYLQRPAYPNEQRFQVADTFSISKGRHLIKFGVDVSHINDLLQSYASGDQLGEFSYTYLQDYLSDYISSINNINGGRACKSANSSAVPCYNFYEQSLGPFSFNVTTIEPAFFVQDDWHATSRLTVNAGLRWDHESFPPPVVPNPAVPLTTSFPSDNKDLGPRIGLAYDLTGQGRTVLRGGYGLYYGRITNEQIYEELTLTGSPSGQLFPEVFPTTTSGGATAGAPIYPNIFSTFSASVGVPNIVYFPSDLRLPAAEEFDGVLEHQIATNTVVSLSYIGSIGRFLPVGIDTNLPAPTTINYKISGGPLNGQTVTYPFFAGPRPNVNYQHMTMYCTCVTSHYNAAVAQLNRRMTKGLQFSLSYTYASDTDDSVTGGSSSGGSSTSAAVTTNGPVNPFNLRAEEGTSNLEVRNRFVGLVVWQPPYFANSSSMFTRSLLAGWTISLSEIAQDGLPLLATISGNEPSGLNPAPTVSSGGASGGNTSSRALFVGKNSTFLPGTVNTDMRIGRSFRVHEHAQLEFTLEAFNLFNHRDFTSASNIAYTTGGTAATPTLTYNTSFASTTNANNSVYIGQRQLQLGGKFTF